MAAINLGGGSTTYEGGSDVDEVNGEGGDDDIRGGGGNDILHGNDDNDRLLGGDDNDLLYGDDGLDTLVGGNGVDTLYGGNGDDYLQAGGGNQTNLSTDSPSEIIDGGAGDDTLSIHYEGFVFSGTNVPFGTVIDISTGTGIAQLSGFQGESFTSIERLEFGGGDGNDVVTGGALDDRISTGSGNDKIYAGAGDDYIGHAAGNFEVDGGIGTDKLQLFRQADNTIVLNADMGTVTAGGTQVGTFENIEDLSLFAGAQNDTLTGLTTGKNTFFGGNGNDTITGGTLADYLEGNNNNDTLVGGGGADELRGGKGVDSVSGGAGDDLVQAYLTDDLAAGESYDGGSDNDVFQFTVGNVSPNFDFSSVTLTNFETLRLESGFLGIQYVYTLSTTQFLQFSFIDMTVLGPTQTLKLSNNGDVVATGKYDVSKIQLANGGQKFDASGSVGGTYTLLGGTGNDVVTGANMPANFFTTNLGSGKDTFIGGTSLDQVTGGLGDDTLDGGVGIDTVSYADMTVGVTVSLALQGNIQNTGAAGNDKLSNFEKLTGGTGNDTLSGDTNANTITGGVGNDTLYGGGGIDTLNGGSGNDTFIYDGNGAVTVNFGNTFGTGAGDVIRITSGFSDFTALKDAMVDTGSDILINFAAGNSLTIKSVANRDVFAADDFVFVANKVPVISSNGGAATAAISMAENGTTVTTVKATDADNQAVTYVIDGGADAALFTINAATGVLRFLTAPDFENPVGGDNLYQVIVGASDPSGAIDTQTLNVTVTNVTKETVGGTDSDDLFKATSDIEAFVGGLGNDTVSHELSGVGVMVNLATPALNTGIAKGDTYNGVENLTGTSANDILTGNAGINILTGAAGNDTLDGGAGADTLLGGGGGGVVDTVSYKNSAAAVYVDLRIQNGSTAQSSTFNFFDPSSTVDNGDAAGDVLSGIESVVGSKFNDVLIGRPADDAANLTDGGEGNDLLFSDTDGDAVLGGAGIDTLSFALENIGVTIDLSKQGVASASRKSVNPSGVNSGQIAPDLMAAEIENLIGSANVDTLKGDSKNNVIEGGAGADTLIGGGGTDTVSYARSSTRVYVDLSNQNGVIAQDAMHDFGSGDQANGDAAGDILSGFAGLIGSDHDDFLFTVQNNKAIGNSVDAGDGNDYIGGGLGKDIISGGSGNDEAFLGLGGADKFDGGEGTDIATFNTGTETAGIVITLGNGGTATGFSASGGAAAGLVLLNVESLGGTTKDDKLTGNELHNELDGGASGKDTLDGRAGDDTLAGADGNDLLTGGVGADILDGGNDTDTVSYALSTAGVTVNLNNQGAYLIPGDASSGRGTAGAVQTGGDAQGDTLWSIENVVGSKLGDRLIAATSGPTTTVLDGSDGNDTIVVGASGEVLLGGAGIDTLSFAALTSAVQVLLANQGTVNSTRTGVTGSEIADGYRAAEFENIIGTGFNDKITGNAGANVIEGGVGADTLNGGLGINTVSYAGSTTGVVIKLFNQGTINATTGAIVNPAAVAQSGGDAAGDTLYGFKNVIGSANDDTLSGDKQDNALSGGAGDDTFIGGAAQNDSSMSAAGKDTFDGDLNTSNGGDIVDYSLEINGITLTLGVDGAAATVTQAVKAGTASNASGDILIDIEKVLGGTSKDVLTGNNLAHTLNGLDGDDILTTGTGVSTLDGGAGDDTIYVTNSIALGRQGVFDGGINTDTIDFSKRTSFGVVLDLSAGNGISGLDLYDIQGFEKVFGSNKDDMLRGNENTATRIDGGLSNDTIEGGALGDTLIGGGGSDTLSYAHSDAAGVVIKLKAGQAVDVGPGSGDSAGDVATGFENLIGSGFDDTLIGDTGANVIEGGLGADMLFGGAGIDTVSYASSSAGVSVRLARQGTTQADGFTVVDVATAQSGNGDATGDLLYGFENITGSNNSDALSGDGSVNILRGGAGDDHLVGGAGGDTLDGGADYDEVDYSLETVGFTLKLGGLNVVAIVTGGSAAHAAGDKLINIEQVNGGSGDDNMTASDLGSALVGQGGNDTLIGGKGTDTLYGEGGDDIVYAGLGGGIYGGGTGAETKGDTLSFAKILTASVDANLATENVTIAAIMGSSATQFEILVGSGKDDTLTGNATTKTSIDGGAGNDIIKGGTAIDTLKGGTGNDKFVFVDAGQGFDHIVDFAAGDKLQISKSGFAGGLENLGDGALTDASYFVSGANASATGVGHGQFLYNTTTRDLSWDADGVAGGAVQIAHFDNIYVLKMADLLIAA